MPQLTPPDTDAEYINTLWQKVRTSCCNTLDLPSLHAKMAGEQDVIGNRDIIDDLRQFGIDIVADDEPGQFFRKIQDCLRGNLHRPRDSGVGVWQEEESNCYYFNELADNAKDYTDPRSTFLCFYNFMHTQIFTIPPLSVNRVIEINWHPLIFELSVSAKSWDSPPIQKSIKPTSTAQSFLPTIKESVAKARSTTERTDHITMRGTEPTTASGNRSLHTKTPSYSFAIPETVSIAPPLLPNKLIMPLSHFDFAYWIDVKVFFQDAIDFESKVFVTRPRPPLNFRATSPYLSIAFDDKLYSHPGQPSEVKKQYVIHKLAVYGSGALYNRFQLSKRASALRARQGKQLEYDEDFTLLHFGVMALEEHLTIYVFKCKNSHVHEWTGCTMNTLYTNRITHVPHLRKVKDRLDAIHEWGLSSYVKGLKIDIDCLADQDGLI
jgi:hypothetical protein